MNFETIETHRDKYVGVITLNRPDQLNAISAKMTEEVTHVMDEFSSDEDVRAIVLKGAGRAFSAGFDMKESSGEGEVDIDEWRGVLERDFAHPFFCTVECRCAWRSRVSTLSCWSPR